MGHYFYYYISIDSTVTMIPFDKTCSTSKYLSIIPHGDPIPSRLAVIIASFCNVSNAVGTPP